jgi:hypothetical protein
MSSPQLTRGPGNNDANNDNNMAAIGNVADDSSATAAVAATDIDRRPRHSRSVRYTREPCLGSENTAGGASVELGSDMTEITHVGITGGTDTDRASR